jgi:hypothetical protein
MRFQSFHRLVKFARTGKQNAHDEEHQADDDNQFDECDAEVAAAWSALSVPEIGRNARGAISPGAEFLTGCVKILRMPLAGKEF